jgi:hypothetical protein
MKAFAELKRRQISTAVAAAPLPSEGLDYQPLSLGKVPRRRLHSVSPLEMPTETDSLGVDEAELAGTVRNSQGMIPKVATSLVIRPAFNKPKSKGITTPMLTTEEFIQVRLATVRESTRHCYWPADVVATFAAADVIR